MQFFVTESWSAGHANNTGGQHPHQPNNWSAGGLSGGQHTLKVVVDPEQQFVRFADGSNVFESTFYVGDGGWGLANILLAIVLVIFMVVVFLTYMNRGKKKKRRPRA